MRHNPARMRHGPMQRMMRIWTPFPREAMDAPCLELAMLDGPLGNFLWQKPLPTTMPLQNIQRWHFFTSNSQVYVILFLGKIVTNNYPW